MKFFMMFTIQMYSAHECLKRIVAGMSQATGSYYFLNEPNQFELWLLVETHITDLLIFIFGDASFEYFCTLRYPTTLNSLKSKPASEIDKWGVRERS
jgi:hypothetical protein